MAYQFLTTGVTARNVEGIMYIEDIANYSYGKVYSFFESLKMEGAISCVHDKDTFTEEDVHKYVLSHTDMRTGEFDYGSMGREQLPQVGEHKKPHIHWYLKAKGAHNGKWWHDTLAPLVDIAPHRIELCKSEPGTLRYFAHLGCKDKHNYGALSVQAFGGLDLSCLLKSDTVTKLETLIDVMDYAASHNMRHYCQVVNWAFSTGDIDTIACVTGRASFFANHYKSLNEYRKERAKIGADGEDTRTYSECVHPEAPGVLEPAF